MIDPTHKSVQFDWANISRKYRRSEGDWITLCRGCHKLFDVKKLTVQELREVFKKRQELLATL